MMPGPRILGRNYHIIFLLTILSTACFGQNDSLQKPSSGKAASYGKVEYIASLSPMNEEQMMKLRKNATALEVIQNAEDVKATLFFTEKETRYRVNETLEKGDKTSPNITRIFAGGKRIFYTDVEKGEFLEQNDLLGEAFLVSSEKIEWKITGEKKVIGGYECFRAVPSAGANTVAWFTPEIPLSYGPKNYHGLPGLVLELSSNIVTIKAINIDWNPLPFEIKELSGIKISREDYLKELRKNSPFSN